MQVTLELFLERGYVKHTDQKKRHTVVAAYKYETGEVDIFWPVGIDTEASSPLTVQTVLIFKDSNFILENPFFFQLVQVLLSVYIEAISRLISSNKKLVSV